MSRERSSVATYLFLALDNETDLPRSDLLLLLWVGLLYMTVLPLFKDTLQFFDQNLEFLAAIRAFFDLILFWQDLITLNLFLFVRLRLIWVFLMLALKLLSGSHHLKLSGVCVCILTHSCKLLLLLFLAFCCFQSILFFELLSLR